MSNENRDQTIGIIYLLGVCKLHLHNMNVIFKSEKHRDQ